ncbi:MAG: hypothetical protein JWN60_2948 [Acidobacteria bacterium]|jgi:uncharacterized protein (TIGR02271 family)|nr:hypothetical protein [Acidobacteriota bacterium]
MEEKAKKQSDLNPNEVEMDANASSNVIPVIEEEIVVDKYIVEKGKVRVSKRISEHEEIVDEPLFHEEVKVERVPVNKFIDAAPPIRREGDTLIIPVIKEQLIVQKRLVLIEELHVRKELVETHQPQTITLLKEQVEINRVADNTDSAANTKGNAGNSPA